jgi:FkbM family methyltransferase
MESGIVEFKTRIATFKCYKNDDAFFNALIRGYSYEEDIIVHFLVKYFINANVILDIGGHIGSHSILYSILNKNATIHVFEPQQKIYDLLTDNININNCSNIKHYNCAVGHSNINCNMSAMVLDGYNHKVEYGTDNKLNLGGLQLGLDGESVNMITIDSLNLEDCNFIKIDVEGAENLVINGALNTIKKYHPTIFFECTDKLLNNETISILNGNNIKSSVEQLEELNYKILNVDKHNKIAIYN